MHHVFMQSQAVSLQGKKLNASTCQQVPSALAGKAERELSVGKQSKTTSQPAITAFQDASPKAPFFKAFEQEA